MKAVVLCAGRGTRLGDLTQAVPKPMLPLDDRPLLDHTLEWLAWHGVRDVAINLHWLGRMISDYVGDGRRWGLHVIYSHEPELLGTAGALLPLEDWIGDEPFVVVYGDKYCQADLTALIQAHHRAPTILTVAVHHTDRPHGAGLASFREDGLITRYEEKPETPFSEWANAGLYACRPGVLSVLPDGFSDWGRDVLPSLVSSGSAYAYPLAGLAMDIGTPERYATACRIASRPGAVFLDRDGTINRSAAPGQYILEQDQFHFTPLALDALAFLAKNFGDRIAVVSNQPCIGRGLVTRGQVDALHRWMIDEITRSGGRIDGVFVCPHTHGSGCSCRKPKPGLLLEAAREWNINLAKSALVGDTVFDVEAAWSAGIREIYWLRAPARALLGLRYTPVESLLDAALLIVSRHQHRR